MSTQTPRLVTLLDASVQAGLSGLWTALPGRVVAVDHNFLTVDVQPLVQRAYTDEEGDRAIERLPVLTSTPIQYAGGAAGHFLFPVHTGDDGLLIMTSCALDRYLTTGNECDPVDDRRNTLKDAYFIPGITHWAGGESQGGPPDDYDTTDVVIASRDLLRLGGKDANESLIQGTSFANAMATFFLALDTWGAAVGTATGVAWGPVQSVIPDVGDFLSGKVVTK